MGEVLPLKTGNILPFPTVRAKRQPRKIRTVWNKRRLSISDAISRIDENRPITCSWPLSRNRSKPRFNTPTDRILPIPSMNAPIHSWKDRCRQRSYRLPCYFDPSRNPRNCGHLLCRISVEILRGKTCSLLQIVRSTCHGREPPSGQSTQAPLRESKRTACFTYPRSQPSVRCYLSDPFGVILSTDQL